MADENIYINSVLCFIISMYVKYPIKQVKSILIDFYEQPAISEAKERLMTDIEKLILPNWNKPNQRRGDNRKKSEIDDIYSALACADENGRMKDLPKYVVMDINTIPIIRLEKGEFSVIVSKLDSIFSELDSIKAKIINPPVIRPTGISFGPSLSQPAPAGNITVRGKPSSSVSNNVGEAMVMARSTCSEEESEGNGGPWSTQERRKRRRRVTSPQGAEGGVSFSDTVKNFISLPSSQAPKPRIRLVGRGTADPSSSTQGSPVFIKPASRPPVRKAVYAVYNVDKSETCESISESLKRRGINVLSCFDVNFRDINKRDQYKAFRVCIDRKCNDLFLNEDIWPAGITVKEWVFKPRDRPQSERRTSQSDGGAEGEEAQVNTAAGSTGAADLATSETSIMN